MSADELNDVLYDRWYDCVGDGWNSTLRASQSGDDSTDYSLYSPKGTNYKTTQQQLTWQNDIKIATGSLLAAIESLKQKAVSGTNFDKSRDPNSLLFGWSGRYGQLLTHHQAFEQQQIGLGPGRDLHGHAVSLFGRESGFHQVFARPFFRRFKLQLRVFGRSEDELGPLNGRVGGEVGQEQAHVGVGAGLERGVAQQHLELLGSGHGAEGGGPGRRGGFGSAVVFAAVGQGGGGHQQRPEQQEQGFSHCPRRWLSSMRAWL